MVYTEMEGEFNFNSGHAPRRISWGARQAAATDRGTVRRFLCSVFACFGRGHAPSAAVARAMPELNDDDVVSDHSAAFIHGSRSWSTSWRLKDGRADAMVQR
jgi:E3 ubiquitin-protein ligase RNF115/126